jgi:hypothetical protein
VRNLALGKRAEAVSVQVVRVCEPFLQPLHLSAEAAAVRICTKSQAFGFGEFGFEGAGN